MICFRCIEYDDDDHSRFTRLPQKCSDKPMLITLQQVPQARGTSQRIPALQQCSAHHAAETIWARPKGAQIKRNADGTTYP